MSFIQIIFLLIIAVFFLLAILLVVALVIASQKEKKQWLAFATHHQLTTHSQALQGITFTGHIFGRQVRLIKGNAKRSEGGRVRQVVQIHVMLNLPPSTPKFSLETRDIGHKLAAFLGDEDHGQPLGDPELDDAFVVQTQDHPRLSQLLRQPRVKEAIMTLCKLHYKDSPAPTNKFAQELIARTKANLPELELASTHIQIVHTTTHGTVDTHIRYIEDVVRHAALLEHTLTEHVHMIR